MEYEGSRLDIINHWITNVSLRNHKNAKRNLLGGIGGGRRENTHSKSSIIPQDIPRQLVEPIHSRTLSTSTTLLHDVRIKHCQCRLGVMADIAQHKATDKFVQHHHEFLFGQLSITELEPPLAIFHDTCEIEFEFEEFGDVFERTVEGPADGGEVLELG